MQPSTTEKHAYSDLSVATSTAAETRATFARDFGWLVEGRVQGVARPANLSELVALVVRANQAGLTLTPRSAGNSQSGQSVPLDGWSLDLSALDEVSEVNTARAVIKVGPSATWRKVLNATLAHGLVPRVMPLNLDLTVGGTLSAGGIGSTSHTEGASVWNVEQLEVVTGGGDVVLTSAEQEPRLFAATLGGVGRVGIISAAWLRLRPARARVRTHYLMYEDLSAMLDDQRSLAQRGAAVHLEGFCAATVMGLRKGPNQRRAPLALWSYGLHVSVEHDGTPPPEDALAGLRFARRLHDEDDSVAEFSARYDVRFEAMRLTGADRQLHPWFECLVPFEAAKELVPKALSMLPMFFGDGHRLTCVADCKLPVATAFPQLKNAVAFAVLPMGIPQALREPALGALRAVNDLFVSAGGRRYVSGWLFGWDEAAQRAHYGALYDTMAEAKRTYDPNQVLSSVLFPRLTVR